MAACLQQLASAWTLQLHTECVDVKRSARQDLSLPKVRQSYLTRIAAKEFDAVLLSPPCATFSRAAWANFRGPRPIRSYECPRGLETLTPAERDRAILGNIFADFSYEVAALVADGAATFMAMEQPEDLGALASGPHEGLRPASMWQWPQLADLLSKGLRTVAFHQASFGTPYAKPTRLLLHTPLLLPDCVHEGMPRYDSKGCYVGPLPSAKGHGAMFQRQATGAFKTSGSEQWPAKLCQWLSAMLVSTCLHAANAAVGEGDHAQPEETLPPSSETFPLNHPEGPRVLGGTGPPRFCRQLGGGKPFHDGGGLCSPGRWPHQARSYADGPQWEWLRKRTLELILAKVGSMEQLEKEAFRMAAGGEKGCTLASDPELHRQLRELWKDWLEAQDLGEPGLLDVAPGQPLHLRLLRAMLEAAGDPDRDFLRQAEEGLPVGILDPLPRTPHVFEEQLKWPLENSPWEASLAWVPNYSSVEEHADFAREKFEEDVREGLMAKMTMGEFLERYGEHTAIAALAVIVEDEELDKKRIIHDATHGVRVNHRIKCRDKLRSPGAREKKHLLREHEEEGETAFSVVGDIAKAHRRYKHAAKEHGYLACQVDAREEVPGDPASQTVYVNQVGTFGLSCASYWWTRIAACGLRLTYHLLGPDFPLDLLLYADDLEAMGKGAKGRRGIPLSYLFLATLGYPFKWAKTRGGFRVEWLGMETEYPTYKLGLSLKRATWLVEWLRLLARTGKTEAKAFAQGLGRLGFASIALDWERPFLGPLHAWSSAVQGKPGPLTLPTMVRVLCGWLADRLESGGRLQKPEPLLEGAAPLSFFTDAKAEAGRAWIGGFLELVDGCQGPWFSLEVVDSWAPWAFAKGDPGKVIAALELLATLVGVRLWVPDGDAKKTSRVAIRGYTDNQSNESLLRKAMTTKFPSTLILMELAEELSAKNCELQL